jgi:hypothetical protein
MISYSSAQSNLASEITALLKDAKVDVWIDREGIQPGARWRDELLKQLRVCEACVPILSRKYLESEHCRMELLVARSFGRRILPVMVEDCWGALDAHEATRGLGDIFMMRLFDTWDALGLPLSRGESLERVVRAAAKSAPQPTRPVYITHLQRNAKLATEVALTLSAQGVPAWVSTLHTEVGDNWRQAQVRAMSGACAQLVILNKGFAESDLLRTELLLSEAVGLPVFTAHHPSVMGDGAKIAAINADLRSGDLTYRRLFDTHAFQLSTSDPVAPAQMAEVMGKVRG